ncbi:MAG TPA: DUF2946 family protein [Burkholderiales bacterium]
MPSSSHRFTSWIALFAVLFSVISPALAALRFYGNAEVLANIISVHPAAHNSAEHQHSSHANSKAHEVYCSFCLDMVSVKALTPAAPHLPSRLVSAQTPSCVVGQSVVSAPPYPQQHPRAPPVVLV